MPDKHHNPQPKRPDGWNRKCNTCGEDPWPNYFYCAEGCHTEATKKAGSPEMSGIAISGSKVKPWIKISDMPFMTTDNAATGINTRRRPK